MHKPRQKLPDQTEGQSESVGVSFNKVEEALTRNFFREICEIFKNTYFGEHLRTTASYFRYLRCTFYSSLTLLKSYSWTNWKILKWLLIPLVLTFVSSCSLVFIRVYSCSTCVQWRSLVFFSCSFVFCLCLLMFTCVHSRCDWCVTWNWNCNC